MLKYLIAILDKNAPSFCYYETPDTGQDTREIMDVKVLEKVITFAESQQLAINFLGYSDSLPESHITMIKNYENHAKFMDVSESSDEPNCISILNSSQKEVIKDIKESAFRNIILRLEKKDLKDLYFFIQSLLHKCKRLNLCLLDVYTYNQEDLKIYKTQLDEIAKLLVSEYKAGHPIELNFLSDRMLLTKMNNCNAGIEHVSVGPQGNFYICPGFYYHKEPYSIGNINDGLNILNKQLLDINHAPICSICDAYHCKRCIYLNKTSTLEVNTPSYQQCATSHLERDSSRIMLEELKDIEPFSEMEPIKELDYIDPLLVLTGKIKKEMPGKPKTGKKPVQQKKAGPKSNVIIVKDGDKVHKLPRLQQVTPAYKKNQEQKQIKKQGIKGKQGTNELDTETTKGLLLEILKTQKQILEVLKKELGGNQ